jgi:hypothetical protein
MLHRIGLDFLEVVQIHQVRKCLAISAKLIIDGEFATQRWQFLELAKIWEVFSRVLLLSLEYMQIRISHGLTHFL